MNYPLAVKIKYPKINDQKMVIEINIDKLEKIAATFGFFNPELLKSMERAENECKTGKIKKIKSLKTLRN